MVDGYRVAGPDVTMVKDDELLIVEVTIPCEKNIE